MPVFALPTFRPSVASCFCARTVLVEASLDARDGLADGADCWSRRLGEWVCWLSWALDGLLSKREQQGCRLRFVAHMGNPTLNLQQARTSRSSWENVDGTRQDNDRRQKREVLSIIINILARRVIGMS